MALISATMFIDFPSYMALVDLTQLVKLRLGKPHTAQDRFLKLYAVHRLPPWSEIYFYENRFDHVARN